MKNLSLALLFCATVVTPAAAAPPLVQHPNCEIMTENGHLAITHCVVGSLGLKTAAVERPKFRTALVKRSPGHSRVADIKRSGIRP